MPQKIRELLKELEMAGFINRGGKGSHRNSMHPSGVILTIAGHPGDDPKLYQVRLVEDKIGET